MNQAERLTLVNAALACCAFDPNQARAYIDRAGMPRAAIYIHEGGTVARAVRAIVDEATRAGVLPGAEVPPQAGTCSTCKHWKRWRQPLRGRLVVFNGEQPELVPLVDDEMCGQCECMKPGMSTEGDDIYTTPNFGCVLWEKGER